MDDVVKYFHEQGITIVTIQPEFKCANTRALDCMVKCVYNSCADKICCKNDDIDLTIVTHVDNEEDRMIIPQVSEKDDASFQSEIEGIRKKSKSLANLVIDSKSLDNSESNLKERRRKSLHEYQDPPLTSPPSNISLSQPNLQNHKLFLSDSHLPNNETRHMREMPEDYEINFNVETFNIDQVGKKGIKEITSQCIQQSGDEDEGVDEEIIDENDESTD